MRWLALLFASLCAAEDAAIVYPVTLSEGSIIPQWSGGNLVFPRASLDLNAPNLVVYDARGTKRYELRLADQSFAADRTVRAFDLKSDGSGVLALGRYYRSDGGVAFVDGGGRITSSFETGRYAPDQIALADDGTVWTFGAQSKEVPRDEEDDAEYNTVRHYAADGKLLGSYVPRSTFIARMPFSHLTNWGVPEPFLRVYGKRVSLYSEHSRLYMELDEQGREQVRWSVPTLKPHDVLCKMEGLASEQVFAACMADDGSRRIHKLGPNGWNDVGSIPAGYIIGSDGARFAVMNGPQIAVRLVKPY